MQDTESQTNPPAAGDTDAPLTGRALLKEKLKSLPAGPGVYRMIGKGGDVLYVGKAKNIRKRVSSYAAGRVHSNRTARMVSQIRDVQVVTTKSESEALLMEAQQIKRYKPPFNILLRDDKSFPYILIRTDHEWPQLTKHRGAQKAKGYYFGPFASAGAVNKTLNTLQRAFLLRSCSDGFFESRTRPCLLYQIKRCAAPCVDRISHEDYDRLVGDTREFLQGKSQTIQRVLSEQMQAAAENMEYEQAAAIRDRIRALTRVQSHQGVNTRTAPDADVIAAHQDAGQTCVQVFFYRGGQNWGTRSYFPRHDKSETVEEVLSSFVAQFYDNKPAPKLILLSHSISGRALLEEALNLNAPQKVQILRPQRGGRKDMVELAEKNARDSLAIHLAESSTQQKLMAGLAEAFDLDSPPQRIEAYDNSHISGQDALGAMVVMGPDGFQKNAYRKFNIREKDIPPGDDYGMMREVFRRRFSRLIKEDPERDRGHWPDLVLIDGGAGQLSAVMEVMSELGLEDVPLVAIAKGPERNAGRERFFMPDGPPFSLDPASPVLYFLQRIRDEVHRFVIGGHRARRAKSMIRSQLDDIPGIGPKRKKALLNHFGSAKAVMGATVEDLEAADGISRQTAQQIYDHFHPDG